MRRNYTRWLVVFTFVIIALLIGIAAFIMIDAGSGTIINTHEAPGVIIDLYTISNVYSTKSGNIITYHTDYKYYAKVLSEGKTQTITVPKHDYYSYHEGQEIILFTYTTQGGISGNIYNDYAIKVLN